MFINVFFFVVVKDCRVNKKCGSVWCPGGGKMKGDGWNRLTKQWFAKRRSLWMARARRTYKDSTVLLSPENGTGIALALKKKEHRNSWCNLICTTWWLFREKGLICGWDGARKPDLWFWSYHTLLHCVMRSSETWGIAEMKDEHASKPTPRSGDTHHPPHV